MTLTIILVPTEGLWPIPLHDMHLICLICAPPPDIPLSRWNCVSNAAYGVFTIDSAFVYCRHTCIICSVEVNSKYVSVTSECFDIPYILRETVNHVYLEARTPPPPKRRGQGGLQ